MICSETTKNKIVLKNVQELIRKMGIQFYKTGMSYLVIYLFAKWYII